jgi:hypothetical protein
MSDSNDTSAIDEKKQQESSSNSVENYTSKVIGFTISVFITILLILFYFTNSALLLFICKLAQSNILPTEPTCAPYTNSKPIINPSPMKTNIFTTFTDPEMSMKLEIPYDDYNSKNKIIDAFREYKQKSSSNFLANYFISIAEALLQFDYSVINTIMSFFNGLPEGLIVGVGPIIAAVLLSFGLLLNFLYFIYLWFANMSWFFKKNANVSGDGLPDWQDVTLTTPVDLCLGIGLVFLFLVIFLIGFPVISFIPAFTIFSAVITCLFYKGSLNGKSVMSFSMIKETLKHYKLSVVSVISIFVVLLAFSKLGTVPGIIAIATVGLIYGGVIGIDIFNPVKETNLSPSVSYNQATKKCPSLKHSDKHGFLYNMVFGQKGGNITKQLKKLGTTL